MVTRENILYSASAFKRMANLIYRKLSEIRVEEWAYVVWVWMPGYCKFWSKKAFQKHFAEWRRQQAKALRVTAWLMEENRYTVRNEAKDSAYVVDATETGMVCTCEDYKNQITILGKGCCKHGYAVLNTLGYITLADYIAAQIKPEPHPIETLQNAPLALPGRGTRHRGRSID